MKVKVFKKFKLFFVYRYKRWITLLIIKKNRDVILKRAKDYYNNIYYYYFFFITTGYPKTLIELKKH